MSTVARRSPRSRWSGLLKKRLTHKAQGPTLESLEAREMMDAAASSLADWYRAMQFQHPADSAMIRGGPAVSGGAAMPTVHLTPGWATFGQALPQGAAYEELQVGDLPTQTDVKTRWPDGSIRFAVVSAPVSTEGDYTLQDATPDAGSFTPMAPGVSVWFRINGQWYGAAMVDLGWGFRGHDNMDWSDRWLDGPLVQEGRYESKVYHWPSGNVYPNLRVLFDTRTYMDGQERVDVTVENTLDQAGAGMERYDVWIANYNDIVFQRSGIEHPYLSRWRQVVNLYLGESEITPDMEPAIQANAVPRYLPSVADPLPTFGGPNFDILGPGDLYRDMEAHGGRPEIAPYPDWTAYYLAHGRQEQRAYVLKHGDLAGSWPIHIRESDGSFVSIDNRPNYWLDPRAEPGNRPAGDLNGRNFYNGATGRGMTPDVGHQPSLAYVPYLLTGDRYYADEMAFWANYTMLQTFQDEYYNARGGSMGLLGPNQVRGIGWGLRNLVDAAAYLPDADPMKAYLAEKVGYNLAWMDNYANTFQTPLGTLFEGRRNENFDPSMNDRGWIALWEQNYVAWAIDHANKQGFEGGLALRDRIAGLQLDLFRNPVTRDSAAPYLIPVGDQVPRGSQNLRYYTDLRQLIVGRTPFQGYYGVDARLMLLIGVENNWDGAQEAYDYLHPQLAEEEYQYGAPDLTLRAGWAVA